jgi:hypothetical protein
MRIRACEGPPAAEPIFHPALPPDLALPMCPMRIAQEPMVARLVTLFARCDRYRVLPRRGGLWAQPARIMTAFDLMREARLYLMQYRQEQSRG